MVNSVKNVKITKFKNNTTKWADMKNKKFKKIHVEMSYLNQAAALITFVCGPPKMLHEI